MFRETQFRFIIHVCGVIISSLGVCRLQARGATVSSSRCSSNLGRSQFRSLGLIKGVRVAY